MRRALFCELVERGTELLRELDHDGFADIYVTNGYISGSAPQELSSFFWRQVVGNSPSTATPSPAYEHGWNAIDELIRSDHTWNGFDHDISSLR